MNAADQKRLFQQALALPERARAQLLGRILESLKPAEKKTSRKERSLAEPVAKYGSRPLETEILSREEWNKTWKAEAERRLAEMESGEDPGVPLEVILEDLRKIADKR